MQKAHTLAIVICALTLASCKEAPPPADRTAAVTTTQPATTTPIDSPAYPGSTASDATPKSDGGGPVPMGTDTKNDKELPTGTLPAGASAPSAASESPATSNPAESPAPNPMNPSKSDETNSPSPMGQTSNPPALQSPDTKSP